MPDELITHVSTHVELYRLAAMLLAPVIVIAGWAIVNNQNNRREDRKELRKSIDDLTKKIDDLEKEIIKFHSSKKYEGFVADEILAGYTKITNTMVRAGLNCDNCMDAAISFNESFSWSNFSPLDFRKHGLSSELILNIRDKANAFQDALELRFSDTVRSPLRRRVSSFILKNQQGVYTFLAYLGLLAFIWTVLEHTPPLAPTPVP